MSRWAVPKANTAVRSTQVRAVRRWAVPKANTAVRGTQVRAVCRWAVPKANTAVRGTQDRPGSRMASTTFCVRQWPGVSIYWGRPGVFA